MKRSRFSEEQIIEILKQQVSGVATADVCRLAKVVTPAAKRQAVAHLCN